MLHGAGIFTYIETPQKWPSYVGNNIPAPWLASGDDLHGKSDRPTPIFTKRKSRRFAAGGPSPLESKPGVAPRKYDGSDIDPEDVKT